MKKVMKPRVGHACRRLRVRRVQLFKRRTRTVAVVIIRSPEANNNDPSILDRRRDDQPIQCICDPQSTLDDILRQLDEVDVRQLDAEGLQMWKSIADDILDIIDSRINAVAITKRATATAA